MRRHLMIAAGFLLTSCAVSVESAPVETMGTLPPPSAPSLPQPVATALEPAVRGTTTLAGTEPPPPPTTVPTGLHGLPFAAEGLSECDEARFYREQFGLPERFDRLTWRESNCKNYVTSRTNCCRGYLQLDIELHLRDHRVGWRYRDNCGVYGIPDAFGDNPLAKQKQMCAAKQLYDVAGFQPWAL